MRATRPLFYLDPGWLFIIAGLTLCCAVMLLPAKHDLFILQSQRDTLRQKELHNNARLRAHVDFLHAVDEADPDLTRRLVASQLNLLPQGEMPVILAANPVGAVHQWLDAAAPVPDYQSAIWTETTLSRLASGPRRIWLLGAGVMCVFLGLLSGGPFGIRARDATPVEIPMSMQQETTEDEKYEYIDQTNSSSVL